MMTLSFSGSDAWSMQVMPHFPRLAKFGIAIEKRVKAITVQTFSFPRVPN
jgi:hypothetical protein